MPPNNKPHGWVNTRTYRVWAGMLSRCQNPNRAKYPSYGGRGITVCEEWQDFRVFLADMGECPPSMSIERIDNNGNYIKSNCRWATMAEQAQNRRNNTYFEYEGEMLCLREITRRAGLPYKRVHDRLNKLGWTLSDALNTPPIRGSRKRNGAN